MANSKVGGTLNNILARIEELGLKLPDSSIPIASYIVAKKSGNLIFTSGQLPLVNGELHSKGILGIDVEIAVAQEAAKICVLNALAAVRTIIPDLDSILSVVRVVGYVASSPTFTSQPSVVNGASELLLEIFGEKGKHARSAVGVAALPLGAPVEIELTVEII